MTMYMTRPGVLLTEICGEYLLVSTKQAREYCPYYSQINENAAFLWKHLQNGADLESLERCVLQEYELQNPDEARGLIQEFVDQMLECGYLLQKGEEHEK